MTLRLSSAPHLHAGRSVSWRMLQMVIALLPVTVFAVAAFGLAALATLLTAIVACLLAARLGRRSGEVQAEEASALPTGLLLGLSLPPALPLWMVALGGVVAMLLGRALFGGLGGQVFPPALVGRIVLQAAFPLAMTQAWLEPFAAGRATALPASSLALPLMAPAGGYPIADGAASLAASRLDGGGLPLGDLWLGQVVGATGETSALLLLLGALYLAWVRAIDWRIPCSLLGTVALLHLLLHGLDPARHPGALAALGSGGLMLGACFLATDPSSSPMTRRGAWLHGALIGGLVVLLRQFGGEPEGVLYAILLGCALVPHIDRWTCPRPLMPSGRAHP